MKPSAHPAKTARTRIWLLLAVVALGLGLRIANLVDISDSPLFTRPAVDGRVYDRWALAIIGRPDSPEAKTVVNEPFYQDPLYPYFLALVYSVFGHGYWAVYLIQLVLAMGLLLLVYDTARRLFDWRAGIAAAGIAALYKPFIFYESQIEKTALAVFLTALLIWLFVRATSHRPQATRGNSAVGHWAWPFASGVALGLAALTRANTLLFAPLLPLALALNPQVKNRNLRIGAAAASLLGLLLVIAPVSVRNSILAREFVLTTTQAGQNLYIGNSQYNTGGLYVAPPWVRPTPDFEQSDFAEYARKVENRRLSYGQVSRFYVRAAVDWARTHPRDFTRLLWRKTMLYFINFEVPDNQDIGFVARYSWVLRLPLFSFGVVFALGLAAMILLGRGLARLSLVVFFFGYAASVIAFFIFSRYRIPTVSALLPFAGAMVLWLADAVQGLRSSRARRPISPARVAGALVLTLAIYAATLVPTRPGRVQADAAISLVNLAEDYCHEGDTARAVKTYEQALATQPGLALASRELGHIMIARNDLNRALLLLSDAAQVDPSDPYAHVLLGEVRQRLRQFDAAVDEFSRAVALAPGRIEFRFELATALQQLDQYPQALAQYDTMIQLAPDNPGVRHNYAVCLYKVGRLDDARAQLETARRLGGQVNAKFDSLLNSGRRPDR